MKLTPWFGRFEKPIRKGVYETNWYFGGNNGFSYWDGNQWSNQRPSIEDSYANGAWNTGACQEKEWRGLAEKPE